MAIKFYRLFDLLQRRNMQKKDLQKQAELSSTTISKMAAGGQIQTGVIDKICNALSCQPGDIMEYIPDQAAPSTKE